MSCISRFGIVHCADKSGNSIVASTGGSKEPSHSSSERPSPEQLQRVFNILAESLPKLFTQAMDYSIYDLNVVFENNIRGTRTV